MLNTSTGDTCRSCAHFALAAPAYNSKALPLRSTYQTLLEPGDTGSRKGVRNLAGARFAQGWGVVVDEELWCETGGGVWMLER